MSETKRVALEDILDSDTIEKMIQSFNEGGLHNLHQRLLTILEPKKDLLLEKDIDPAYLAYAVEAQMLKAAKPAGPKPGARVRVHDGSGKVFLGEGTYEGDVKAYFIVMPDGTLRSRSDAEIEPTPDMVPPGAEVHCSEDNPKIRLDNGQIVYGCQVWWEFVQ